MAISDEIKEQKDKLAQKTWKDKCKYFWDYYKIYTIVGIVLVIIVASFVKDLLTNNQKSVFQATIINSEIQFMDDKYETEFGKYLGIDTGKEKVIFDNTYGIHLDNTDQMTVASSQKIVANTQLALIDVMIAPKDVIEYYAGVDFLSDIRNVISAEQFEELDEHGNICYAKTENGNKIPVGIVVKDTKWIKDTGLYVKQTPILGVLSNTEHVENVRKFLTYMNE